MLWKEWMGSSGEERRAILRAFTRGEWAGVVRSLAWCRQSISYRIMHIIDQPPQSCQRETEQLFRQKQVKLLSVIITGLLHEFIMCDSNWACCIYKSNVFYGWSLFFKYPFTKWAIYKVSKLDILLSVHIELLTPHCTNCKPYIIMSCCCWFR